jgi:hypothetical protein
MPASKRGAAGSEVGPRGGIGLVGRMGGMAAHEADFVLFFLFSVFFSSFFFFIFKPNLSSSLNSNLWQIHFQINSKIWTYLRV